MAPNTIPYTPPAGYRYMLPHEAERLTHGAFVTLMTAAGPCHGTVRSFGDATMTVTLASGAVVTLDLDDPDYWPDAEIRDRRPPMSVDGEYVALWTTGADDDADVEPLLRTSVALARLMREDPELRAAVAEVRRIIATRLRGRAA